MHFVGRLRYMFDAVTGMYFCNARWYHPVIARFTDRDPATGTFQEPLTLHAYLYCLNNPVNMNDRSGKNPIVMAGAVVILVGLAAWLTYEVVQIFENYNTVLNLALAQTNDNIALEQAVQLHNELAETGYSRADLPVCPVAISINPSVSPGTGWIWKGSGPPGSGQGNWINPQTGEKLYFDKGHHIKEYPDGHWDYTDKNGKRWRVDPKTREMKPK